MAEIDLLRNSAGMSGEVTSGRSENVKMTKQRKNSSFCQSAQMMVATECWLVHTKTVVKRMAGSITPSAKNTEARMMRKPKAQVRMAENGGWCFFFAGAGAVGSAAVASVLSHA